VTFLDAYALIALVVDEPAAGPVEKLLRAHVCRVSVIHLAEAVDVSHRRHDVATADIRSVLGPLFYEDVELVPPDEDDAWRAAEVRGQYYKAKTCELSLADCFLLAHAKDGEDVATSDPAIVEVARAEGIAVIRLPDSEGRIP
jgi:uncharacterized protein with PIN domain